ncbi:DUF2336 domain-containing protein [Rhizobium oryzihabitans]|uniref:DUF2336 domain-containing protein n=1 Tax=Rhizobium oryzihabitans TaxID=2267833 RepID=A0A7L5BD47_9HYPH|nr:DUF2336 domain-containing protein [Rhizobium oryzihabitans]QCM05005.1 DUF2336 domain-containing protein [Agrobacterium tumefaciens]QIB36814.1 DUF2336 domain-containing protein [Rhizobium oryzihabitans]CUX20291.1 conserved hypothetical protein [Agrobacterium genomosp. 5 str. CFBP 6626]
MCFEAQVIVQAFLRWSEKAGSTERAKAANALGRAYLQSDMVRENRDAAYMAMTYLLDDPSPRVRLALAEALADAPEAPRAILVSLAEDQPEIACTVIARSPVLTEADLVDLAGRGESLTRALIAARPGLPRGVCAALAEVGDLSETLVLLENDDAFITPFSLRRIAERHGCDADIRALLLCREALPADARHLLMGRVSEALAGSALVHALIAQNRADSIFREAEDSATILIAGNVPSPELPALVEHLRQRLELTPALLIHAVCSGRLEFFTAAMVNLSGLDDRKVRSILATGRPHALKALFKSVGLLGDAIDVFTEATLMWRRAARSHLSEAAASVSAELLAHFRHVDGSETLFELLHAVRKLAIAEERQKARHYAEALTVEAA